MAKKTENKQQTTQHRRSTPSRVSIVDLLAFLALAASAVLLVIGPILKWALENTGGAVVMQALNLVQQYCVLAAIAIPGWYFVRGKRKAWKIAYFIFLAIYVAGTILGMTLGI